MRVMIADDHPLILSGLESLLTHARHEVVACERSGRAALERILTLTPDVAILDIYMPEMNGIDVLRALRADGNPVAVVLLTGTIEDAAVVEALRLRVDGFVLKDTASELLLRCLDAIEAGAQWVDKEAMTRAIDTMARAHTSNGRVLTPREHEIASLVAAGYRNREIGMRLNVSNGTVKTHLHNIFEKLGVDNRAGLVAYVKDHKLA